MTTETTTRTKRPALTNLQRFQIMETLKANGTKDGDKWWLFSEGWSDERIAKQFNCGESQVASIRRDCFGDLKPAVSNTGGIMPIVWDRIKALEARVQQLEQEARRPAGEDKTRLVDLRKQTEQHMLYQLTKPNGV
jgi:hypothetical protein